jgi:hypothetical protein
MPTLPVLARLDVNDESLAASAEAYPRLSDKSRARLQELCERPALSHVVPAAEAVPIVEEEYRTLLEKISEELESRPGRAVKIAVDQCNRDGAGRSFAFSSSFSVSSNHPSTR